MSGYCLRVVRHGSGDKISGERLISKEVKGILGAMDVSKRHLKLSMSKFELIFPPTSVPAAFPILIAEVRNLVTILSTFLSLTS